MSLALAATADSLQVTTSFTVGVSQAEHPTELQACKENWYVPGVTLAWVTLVPAPV